MGQKFANYIAAPFVGAALIFLYLAWTQGGTFAYALVPTVLVSALVYTFSPQINWWWYSKRPPALEDGIIEMLNRYGVFYQQLSEEDQQKYRDRIALFRMGTEWMPMGWPEETVPVDVQSAIAAQAVALTFNRPKFLFDKFEQVIVYPKPFPSPEYPFRHGSELYEPDGCIIFSADHITQAFLQPRDVYNVAMHEYARAYTLIYPHESYPSMDQDDIWEKLEAAVGMSRKYVESVIGLAGVAPLPVAIHHYFMFREKFIAALPEQAEQFDRIFAAPKAA